MENKNAERELKQIFREKCCPDRSQKIESLTRRILAQCIEEGFTESMVRRLPKALRETTMEMLEGRSEPPYAIQVTAREENGLNGGGKYVKFVDELYNELRSLRRQNRFKELLNESLMQENRKLANRLLWTNILWGLSQVIWLIGLFV